MRLLDWLLKLFPPSRPRPKPKPPPPNPGALEPAEKALVGLVNDHRATHRAGYLVANGPLTRAAQAHADWMAMEGKLSHIGVDGSEELDRARDAGFDGWTVGETIAWNQSDARETVIDWLASPGHRAILLDPRYRFIGVGRSVGPTGPYWCAVFGA